MTDRVNIKRTSITFDCLGCKLNQAETELFARQATEAGYKMVSPTDKADIYVLNTCTVTHLADRKSRHLLRLAHHRNPGARLIAIGCYAERSSEELARIDGVNLVLGNKQKPFLFQRLRESGAPDYPPDTRADYPADGYRTRAFIKVQDGCRNFCTYCIVPLVRGQGKSVPARRVIAEIRQRVAGGTKEVVLTGTEIGTYRSDGVNLKGLLERILAETGVTRLRLSSLQSWEISSDFIARWQNQRLCPHFHLSLQSGSDAVLSRMKRRYTTRDYRAAVSLIRKMVPEAAVTTDIIVGFPGETKEEFQESHDFCRRMAFARIHAFPYSLRPGTEAARMPGQIDAKIKKQRSEQMLTLAKESAQKFQQQFLSQTMPVLWEKQDKGVWSGLTANYIKVYIRNDEDLTNRIIPVKLVKVWKDGVGGGENS
jgi:threonylcarbamoyladenosine tRNA methylthiotransferase MtaB